MSRCREAMRLGAASVVCLTTAILMLVVRGSADWSRAFGLTWYGVFGAAVVFAVAAAAAAVAAPAVTARRRLTIAALALPGIVAVPILIWMIVAVAPLAD
jgi:hypothetical protein